MVSAIDKGCTAAETAINFLESLPIVGIVFGASRVIAGKVQLVSAAIFAGFATFSAVVSSKAENINKWHARSNHAIDHMCHGILNIARGSFAVLMGATLIGSGFLFFAQHFSANGFEPIIKYENKTRLNIPVPA